MGEGMGEGRGEGMGRYRFAAGLVSEHLPRCDSLPHPDLLSIWDCVSIPRHLLALPEPGLAILDYFVITIMCNVSVIMLHSYERLRTYSVGTQKLEVNARLGFMDLK